MDNNNNNNINEDSFKYLDSIYNSKNNNNNINNNSGNSGNTLGAPTPPVAVATNIRVVCRVRPLTDIEKTRSEFSIINFLNSNSISIRANGPQFTFDRIFNFSSTQIEIFQDVAEPIINDFLNGYHGTIMAYGQTASGKTHTMVGQPDPNEHGIIPRVIEKIFDGIKVLRELDTTLSVAFCLKISALELYNEKLYDLYDDSKTNLSIREHKQNGIYVEGITEQVISSVEEAFDFLNISNKNRAIAATKMSAASSRSHSVLMIELSQQNLSAESSKISKLFLVDLAGSERAHKTGAEGDRMQEAKNINLSLSALGKVINALTTGQSFIPYRDSKLTRVLQDSLGGNSKTSLIINCSPSNYNEHETISTLQFGTRAKTIKNAPKVNKKVTYRELEAYIIKLTRDIELLKKESNEKDVKITNRDQEIEILKKELQDKSSHKLIEELYFSQIQHDQTNKILDDNIEEFRVDENSHNNNSLNNSINNNNFSNSEDKQEQEQQQFNLKDLEEDDEENQNNSSLDSITIDPKLDDLNDGPDIHDLVVNASIQHDSDKSSDEDDEFDCLSPLNRIQDNKTINSSLNDIEISPLFNNKKEEDHFNNSINNINNNNLKISTSYITTSPNVSPRSYYSNSQGFLNNNNNNINNNNNNNNNNQNTISPTLSFFNDLPQSREFDQFLSLSSSMDGNRKSISGSIDGNSSNNGKLIDIEDEVPEQEQDQQVEKKEELLLYINDLTNNVVGEDNEQKSNQNQTVPSQIDEEGIQNNQDSDDEIKSISSITTSKSVSTTDFTIIKNEENNHTIITCNSSPTLKEQQFENDIAIEQNNQILDEEENIGGNNGNRGDFSKSNLSSSTIETISTTTTTTTTTTTLESSNNHNSNNSNNSNSIEQIDVEDFGFSKIEKNEDETFVKDNYKPNSINGNIVISTDNNQESSSILHVYQYDIGSNEFIQIDDNSSSSSNNNNNLKSSTTTSSTTIITSDSIQLDSNENTTNNSNNPSNEENSSSRPLPPLLDQKPKSFKSKSVFKSPSFYIIFTILLSLVSLVYFTNTPMYQNRLAERRIHLYTLGIYSDFPTLQKLGEHKNHSHKFLKKLYGYNSAKYQDEASTINTSYNKLMEMNLFESFMSHLLHTSGFRVNDDLSLLNKQLEYKKNIYELSTINSNSNKNNDEVNYNGYQKVEEEVQINHHKQEIESKEELFEKQIQVKDQELRNQIKENKVKELKIQDLETKNIQIMEKLTELENIILAKKEEDQDYQKALMEKNSQLESDKKKFISVMASLESDKKNLELKIKQMNEEILTLKSESNKYQIAQQPQLLNTIWQYVNPKNIFDYILSFF